ncbi:hypothetical protein PLICRDRAFT_170445 [Plicaturopsis crispa FD-325 SS-3]|nr:hypothetical protein PLICRDRAFT_170445 [Plicaturopsis crispa FD-325 SS-3]
MDSPSTRIEHFRDAELLSSAFLHAATTFRSPHLCGERPYSFLHILPRHDLVPTASPPQLSPPSTSRNPLAAPARRTHSLRASPLPSQRTNPPCYAPPSCFVRNAQDALAISPAAPMPRRSPPLPCPAAARHSHAPPLLSAPYHTAPFTNQCTQADIAARAQQQDTQGRRRTRYQAVVAYARG